VNVLVAEDDGLTRAVLAMQLRKLDHTVLEAEDGTVAWSMVQQLRPQIVITDWMMPNMDGLELCRNIRAEQRTAYTYLIILTALDRKAGYLEGMKAGADDFVTKPAEVGELQVRMRVGERILRLQTEVRQLEGLLPICERCKKIHVADGRWEQVEHYISQRSAAQFSHGICPKCYQSVVLPQIQALRKKNSG
jgi:sigma-B regulation protein RsbU (phosphoserine phosphatase)